MYATTLHPYRKGPPDATALAVARAAQAAAGPATVVLFGSRARGDWRETSDIDMLLIGAEDATRPATGDAYGAAREYCTKHGIDLDITLIAMSRGEFERCRRAGQHIAGQSDTYGVVMSGEELEYRSGYEDGYPDHWPETARRIRAAESNLQDYQERVESNHWNQQLMGFAAQQAVENALKGILSAHNERITYTHDLLHCWAGVTRLEDKNPEASELLEIGQLLFDYVATPNPARPHGPQDWLTKYAGDYRYREPEVYMSRAERLELYAMIKPLVELAIDHVYRLSGVTELDVYPDGRRPWQRSQPES